MLLLQVAVLLAVVGLGFALEAWQLDRSLEQRFQQRALDVARTLATQPGLAEAVLARDQPTVQRRAHAVQQATGALFVVITDDAGIRLAHPNPDEIGKLVSTSPHDVLQGREVTNIERGTLGLSARGKVPLRTGDGAIVGEVSVGFDASDISAALVRLLRTTALFLGGALLLGVGATWLLTRLLKRRTFGLEPSDLAELVREREAVLFGVSDGVIALDGDGVVTMANSEAVRLIGVPVPPGAGLLELDLPVPLRRAMTVQAGRSVAVVGDRVLVVTHRLVQHGERPLGSVITVFDRTEVENLTTPCTGCCTAGVRRTGRARPPSTWTPCWARPTSWSPTTARRSPRRRSGPTWPGRSPRRPSSGWCWCWPRAVGCPANWPRRSR